MGRQQKSSQSDSVTKPPDATQSGGVVTPKHVSNVANQATLPETAARKRAVRAQDIHLPKAREKPQLVHEELTLEPGLNPK